MNIRPYVTAKGREIQLTSGITIGSFEPSQRKILREALKRFIDQVQAFPDEDAYASAHTDFPQVEMITPFGRMYLGYVGQKRWEWNINHISPDAIKRWEEVQTYPPEEFGFNAWGEPLTKD